ncbi:MAG: ABC transporter [Dethiosulfovibrio peptidovorans]|nr:MAG: ABC transporter [Dethiosulfovibrio peptidovorans]
MAVIFSDLSCGYGRTPLISGLSGTVESGQVLAVLGPNGVGKTTFFRSILGLIPLMAGSLTVDGYAVLRQSPRERARLMAYVPQESPSPYGYSALDMVTMGRTCHLGPWTSPSRRDKEVAKAELAALGIGSMAERSYTTLSGGERQLVLVARALAQEPSVLVMDEPTASLDMANRHGVMSTVRKVTGRGISVIFSTHSPEEAYRYADQVLLMGTGSVSWGGAREIISDASMSKLYGLPVHISRLHGGLIAATV